MSGSDAAPAPRTPRVVVGVNGEPGSRTALRRAAAEARHRRAALWPVLAWQPPCGGFGVRHAPVDPLPAEDWQDLARATLLGTLDEVFPDGPGVPVHALLAQGTPGRVLVEAADREDDLLVVGAGHRGTLHRMFQPSVSRYCLARAHCPVLAVPPSPLEAELAAAHRRNLWRLRLDTRHFAEETAPDDGQAVAGA
ncbi:MULTISPECIES: universal stress protein [unclassified Streptomyces]|uniref:universal stress protein n=1 Tax=unclassified Streptomyces TaxID=2593676 RepID=UPI000DB9A7FA|nr:MULTISPECIES: universal stress protein [unclassified Streptomyces]MYT74066.1 universal stress protein [Streptomyces sp. SID8367]RAJ89483.1 nucleotide-binding universal stress UspA family protein [Streptomyces sp. PsTaAH-137]